MARLTNQWAIRHLGACAEVVTGGGGQSLIAAPGQLLGLVRERLPLLLGRAKVGLPAVDVRFRASPLSA